jgi:hypothetical protein
MCCLHRLVINTTDILDLFVLLDRNFALGCLIIELLLGMCSLFVAMMHLILLPRRGSRVTTRIRTRIDFL